MKCKKCGAEIKDTMKFCNKCGTTVILGTPYEDCGLIKAGQAQYEAQKIDKLPVEKASTSAQNPLVADKLVAIEKKNIMTPMQPPVTQKEKETITDDQAEPNITISNISVKEELSSAPLKPKNKVVAGLLAIFLGFFGIHWFYLGKPIRAILYLIVYLIFPSIWFLYIVEGIYFICAKQDSFDKYRVLI